ncbi:sugar phosphate isomerase/epimerase family protein [Paenibacillus sonchi]|uniref:sugar phosphate isomerase/epimerase family protein n=1 Tax=Paenibacillus sonchi TaxID=373687 RepID=UPI001E4A028A|nr:sugar phosphate isomerase/epimerase [Paenibacillus sonchi]MCE3200147.1 sugar phosphate isomerase/epimerase [Paenibacillus sonchi]
MQISVFYNHIVTASKQTGLPLPEVLGLVRGYGIQAVELDLDEEAFEKLKSRIVHVHCKDRSLEEHPGEVPKISTNGTRLFPSLVGSGCIPVQAILDRLETIGYKNTVAIEHFDAADQLAYMKQSAQWLQATFNPLQI